MPLSPGPAPSSRAEHRQASFRRCAGAPLGHAALAAEELTPPSLVGLLAFTRSVPGKQAIWQVVPERRPSQRCLYMLASTHRCLPGIYCFLAPCEECDRRTRAVGT